MQHNRLGYTYWALHGEWRFVGPEGPVSVRISGNMEANNGEALRAAALRGQGIILQPSFIVGDDLAAGRLEPLLHDYRAVELAIFGVYAPGRHLSAKVRSFLDFLVARYGERPYWDAWISRDAGGNSRPSRHLRKRKHRPRHRRSDPLGRANSHVVSAIAAHPTRVTGGAGAPQALRGRAV